MTTHLIDPPSTGDPCITKCCSKAPHQLPHDDRLSWVVERVDCPLMVVKPIEGPQPMRPARPDGHDTLRAPEGSPRAERYYAIRRLYDGTVGTRLALQTLGVQPEEFDRW